MKFYNSWLQKGVIDVSADNGLRAESRITEMVQDWIIRDIDNMGLPSMTQFACTGQVRWCIYDPRNAQLAATPTSPDSILDLVHTIGTFSSMVLITRSGNELKVFYGRIESLLDVSADIRARFNTALNAVKEGA